LIPVKTPEGQAELLTRRLRLSQRHRTVLLLVDGRRTEAAVRQLAAQAGATDTCFDELLGLSLIALPEAPTHGVRGAAVTQPAPPAARPEDPSPRLSEPIPAAADSLLPAIGTLPPDSTVIDSVMAGPPPDSWLPSELDGEESKPADAEFQQAREMLLRAVKNDAPWAGSLTLLRLRRAQSRADLGELLDEVEAHISRPHRSLTGSQTMISVRQLLAQSADSQSIRS
jgi:hypothetical protein